MNGQTGHPDWCSQGSDCHQPKRASDGTVEWDHAARTAVRHLDGVAEVALVRMDAVTADDRHTSTEGIVIGADGTLTADQATRLAHALLAAVGQLEAGLAGSAR